MSIGQHSDAITSWSLPASATGQSPLAEATEILLDEGPSAHEAPSAFEGFSFRGPSTAFPLAPLLDPQLFATTQFEGPPMVHTRPLQATLE